LGAARVAIGGWMVVVETSRFAWDCEAAHAGIALMHGTRRHWGVKYGLWLQVDSLSPPAKIWCILIEKISKNQITLALR
jgi:hypothetical protein